MHAASGRAGAADHCPGLGHHHRGDPGRDPAASLLHILACYAPDNIPRVSWVGTPTRPVAIDRALGLLASYSMITLTPEAMSMHRLVQAVILASCRQKTPLRSLAASPADHGPGLADQALPARPRQQRGWMAAAAGARPARRAPCRPFPTGAGP